MEKFNTCPSFTKVLFLILIEFTFSTVLSAQSETVIYLKDAQLIKIKSLVVENDRIKYEKAQSTFQKYYNMLKPDLKLAFYPLGVYHIFSNSLEDVVEVNYVNGRNAKIDKIITDNATVIAGEIIKESNKSIKYKDLKTGKISSVHKDELAIILYKNGNYHLFEGLETVADILLKVRNEITSLENMIIKSGGNESKEIISNEISVAEDNATPPVDKKVFEKKALAKTMELESYIRIITNKQTVFYKANEAIDAAMKLFLDENSIMEVSSKNRREVKKYKIRAYLTRLKGLKYDDVRVSWSDISYVSDIRLGPSGNYYGTIVLRQKFEGLVDNKVKYSDITTKKLNVILKTYEKYVAGEKKKLWDVFLGDIGVVRTEG